MSLVSSNGGPIVGVQVENEYGSYGNQDPNHLQWLKDLLLRLDVKEPLFTSDGASVFQKPTTVLLKDQLKSINFKNNPERNLDLMDRIVTIIYYHYKIL